MLVLASVMPVCQLTQSSPRYAAVAVTPHVCFSPLPHILLVQGAYLASSAQVVARISKMKTGRSRDIDGKVQSSGLGRTPHRPGTLTPVCARSQMRLFRRGVAEDTTLHFKVFDRSVKARRSGVGM